ncbi:MAG: aminomethyltransferase [Hyphomonadaceae bacterium]|nr:MAG: aminomethyltransferase [Hyphomonadaceae bacterium]
MSEQLKTTPLTDLWSEMGGKMVEFAGYNMPVQFPEGVVKEHLWTRENAGLFDVSHMGPAFFRLIEKAGLAPEAAHIEIAKIIEQVLPCDVQGLKRGQIRYTCLLNLDGGIIDDMMVARPLNDDEQGSLYVVVNAGGKEVDFSIFNELGEGNVTVDRWDENALIALQGPKAKDAIKALNPNAADLGFMNYAKFETPFGDAIIARSGYTGEDGFEILVMKEYAVALCAQLLSNENVKPIGLGARDSLRLEAGLCLYGHDLDETISPIEAGLAWTIQKCRRERANFPGASRILNEIANKPSRKRIGIEFLDRAPAREGTIIQNQNGDDIGIVTSGGFSPSLNVPIAMGYVATEFAAIGTQIRLMVRGTARDARVCAMPFVPHNYFKS